MNTTQALTVYNLQQSLQSYDAMTAYMIACKGEIKINYEWWSRSNLVDIAYHLNVWNANQPVTNKEHSAHYVKFIAPLNKYLGQ